MRSTAKTRVQRRVEKKQGLLLVILVLVIAVASFALGFIVGRNTAEPQIVQQVKEPSHVVVDDSPTHLPDSQSSPAKSQDEKLTFYDNLSKEEPAPIGSGINLPPDGEGVPAEKVGSNQPVTSKKSGVTPAVVASEVVATVKSQSESPAQGTAQPTPVATPVIAPASKSVFVADVLPPVVKGGSWVVQVFASKSAADAGTLRDKLNAKGYPAYITEADLGKKGIWYRVHLGPYADKSAAMQARNYAEKKGHMKGFVKRR